MALRLRLIQTRPEEPQTGKHTAELVDDEGGIAAVGHVIVDSDVSLGGRMTCGLRFVGEGTLGRTPPISPDRA